MNKPGDFKVAFLTTSNCNVIVAQILFQLDAVVRESKPPIVTHHYGHGVDDEAGFKCTDRYSATIAGVSCPVSTGSNAILPPIGSGHHREEACTENDMDELIVSEDTPAELRTKGLCKPSSRESHSVIMDHSVLSSSESRGGTGHHLRGGRVGGT